jgi:DNA (cytosine-5)-methyltransferase 1
MVARPDRPAFRFIDLFAGIGGFHLAMERLGGQCVLACEIDEACQDVYERNLGLRPVGDIRTLTEGTRVEVPEHDVLCAGFPCQPFSKSGFQRGIHEARGTLFFEILRILEAKRPRYAILENVRNLAGPRQRDAWDVVIRSLRSLGYQVCGDPVVFSPHLLPPPEGRPQVRERVFILCERARAGETTGSLDVPPLLENRAVEGWDPARWSIERYLDDEADIEGLSRYRLRPEEIRWIDAWTDLLQRVDEDPLPGFPLWADAFTAKPVVPRGTPAWKENFLRKNSAFYLRHRRTIDAWRSRWSVDDFPPSRRKLEWQARGHAPDLWKLVLHLRPSGIRAKPPSYLPALVAITQTSIVGPRRRRITPREAARLQAFPDSFRLHENDAVAYRQLGNAVNVSAVVHVARALFETSRRDRRNPRAVQSLLFG